MRKVNPEDLRASILQAAIQGKLVPQDPKDEPASVLLDRIREEKQRLIKEGKIKKPKHESYIFRRDNHYYENIDGEETIIDDQLPFEVPPSWEWSRLSNIAIVIMGQSPVGSSVTNDPSGIEFHQGKGCFTKKLLSKSDLFTSAPTKIIDCEAILMSVRAPVGDVNIVNRLICIGRGLCAIKPLINMQYAFAYLSTLKKWLETKATGSTFKAISGDLIQSALIPIPPDEEQSRIVVKLSEIESKIGEYLVYNSQLETLDSIAGLMLKNSLLLYALQGKLVHQDQTDVPVQIQCKNPIIRRDNSYYQIKGSSEVCIDNEIPFSVPPNWNWYHLEDIATITMGQSPEGKSVSDGTDGIEFHQGKKCFGNKMLKPSGVFTTEPTKVIEGKTILMSVRAPVGDINISDRKICIGRGLCSITPFVGFNYVYLFLLSIKEQLDRQSTGTTFRAIDLKTIKSILIPIPPLEEQTRIANKVDNLLSTLSSLNVV